MSAPSTLHNFKPQDDDDRLIRERDVLDLLLVGRFAWAAGIKAGRYPKPVRMGKLVRWRLSDIKALMRTGAPLPEKTTVAEA